MLDNTAVKIAASKLTNTSLLPGSLILLGGIVVWQLWSRQTQLQTETSKLNMQLKNVKRQVEEIKTTSAKSETPISTTFKKFFNR